jgi:protocatechuate 3,4-dioxygenase beta subunit
VSRPPAPLGFIAPDIPPDVAGEYVREDVTEDQAGVPLLMDYQVIDVATCDPIPDVYLEIWHCNATGVYGGVVAGGNGNSDDLSNLDNTWLRGIQPTDSDGVAQFESIFPGHYTGRATHIRMSPPSPCLTRFPPPRHPSSQTPLLPKKKTNQPN